MTDGVYVIRDDDTLVEMRSSAFESAGLLRRLLATHPSLIVGDAANGFTEQDTGFARPLRKGGKSGD